MHLDIINTFVFNRMGIHHCILPAEKEMLISHKSYYLMVQILLLRINMVKTLWMNVKMKTEMTLRSFLQNIILKEVRKTL